MLCPVLPQLKKQESKKEKLSIEKVTMEEKKIWNK